ncbi:MAG: (2Fe-2S)-binding protein [Pseudomonadota bacterium]
MLLKHVHNIGADNGVHRLLDRLEIAVITGEEHHHSERQIEQALAEGCDSVSGLGEALGFGTNCGSCVPELRQLVAQSLPEPSGDG